MFSRQPNGVEIYFNWPSRTARIVPNRSVRYGISLRDNIGFTIVSLMSLASPLIKGHSIVVAPLMIASVVWFVERIRYLSKLEKVPLHISSAQVDKAYIRDVGAFGGVFLTATGVLTTAAFVYIALASDEENAVPLLLLLPLIAAGLIFIYVGFRILSGTIIR